ncbi:MAG: ATP-binding protein [Faecalibacterium sp.]|nr:ATP-binding protein [Ruminococcus sp.]MCM1391353.1 ATP-binding protein [Ruminococcus sp.]MCM1484912.1 ATP-binding protein [Faecalibacterium sp.]
MNRNQIEENSKVITLKYFQLLKETSLTEESNPIYTNLSTNNIYYIKINEISKGWVTEEKTIWEIMTNLFVGLNAVNIPVSIVFNGTGSDVGIYVGCSAEHMDILDGMLKGTFPQIEFDSNKLGNTNIFYFSNISPNLTYGGYLKGNPTGSTNLNSVLQLDSVIKGMAGNPWNISIFAIPISKTETVKRQQFWLSEASKCSELSEVSFSDSDNIESVSYKKTYFHSEQYCQKVQSFCNKLIECSATGEWCVTINFSASTVAHSHLLGGLLTSAFYGDNSEPEPVHAVYQYNNSFVTLINGMEHMHNSFGEIPYPKYATYLSSRELAVFASFPTVDTSGFSVKDYVAFDVNRDIEGDLAIGKILESGRISEKKYLIDSNEFNRHCLVIGLTGSGKTNTVKSLICELTKGSQKPVMIIEPAKKEYWELYKLGYDNIQIYSVGSNEPFARTLCLNPFERTYFTDKDGNKKSVPIQTHIDFVYAAFKASFIMYTPMPYVLEKSIYEIYEDCGWDIHNNTNKNGVEIYPTIEDLYFKIPEVVINMGYDQKMRNDLIGSLQARINSMRLGTKGDTLNVERSFPLDKLLQGNVVIELEDIGDDDIKAFIISLLLVNLLEYRRQQDDCQLEVRHLMLIEEAHRLLKNVQSGSGEDADPRGAAVEFFCNLLAELRSKGQGFIIADQIPSKLAPDLIKNTNLKIVHRTVAEEERILIGGAMHMTDEQIDSLASLKQGVAAVYSEGDNRPKLVKPKYAGSFMLESRKNMPRSQVLKLTESSCITIDGCIEYTSLTDRLTLLCRLCNSHCPKKHTDVLTKIDDLNEFYKIAEWTDPSITHTCTVKSINEYIENFLKNHLQSPIINPLDKFCFLGCLIDQWNIDNNLKKKLIISYINCERGKKI